MTAYVIAEVGGVKDAERIAAYREISTRAAAAGGGNLHRARGPYHGSGRRLEAGTYRHHQV